MHLHRKALLLLASVVVTVAFIALPARAQDSCSSTCSSTTSCDTSCWTCDPPNWDPTYCPQQNIQYVTCGDYTSNCSSCTPNWVRTSRTKIGGVPDGLYCFLGACYCHIESYYTATYHDANNCGQADYTTCESDGVTFFGGTGLHDNDECCVYTAPADISHSDYCGGSSC
jgi:hypothetical protein